MSDIKKFLFDLNDFDEDAIAKKALEEQELPPTFSESELENARAEGFQKGKIAGIDEERASLHQQILDTLSALRPAIDQLMGQEHMRNTRFIDDSIALTLDALEKVFPEIYTLTHVEALKAYMTEELAAQSKLSKLIIMVHPDTQKDIEAHITNNIPVTQDEIKITVKASANIALGHAHIQWDHGGAVWTPLNLHQIILDDIRSYLPKDYEPTKALETPEAKEPEVQEDIINEDETSDTASMDESDKKAHNNENTLSAEDPLAEPQDKDE